MFRSTPARCRSWLAAAGGVCLALACAVVAPRSAADERTDQTAAARRDPPAWVRLSVRGDEGQRFIGGAVVTEAADGGLLVELPEQRYEVVQPESILSREDLPAPPAESARDLGLRVLAELPPGFELHVTRHYVVCFDTSRDYARWCAALFERLHEAFLNTWRRAGLEIAAPDRPLVLVIFAERSRYEALATREVGPAAPGIVGYYSLVTNRVTTFDLTGAAGLRGATRPGRPPGPEILARPESAGLVSTLVHEATHQLAFNAGLHRRLAPIPLWVSEGIATYFETPDLESSRGWRGLGTVNRNRLERFRAGHRPGDLEPLLRGDEPFRRAEQALDAYATAWALTAFLLETRKPQFVDYLRTLAAKPPLADDSPALRLREFSDAFGAPAEVEEALLRHFARLPAPAP